MFVLIFLCIALQLMSYQTPAMVAGDDYQVLEDEVWQLNTYMYKNFHCIYAACVYIVCMYVSDDVCHTIIT